MGKAIMGTGTKLCVHCGERPDYRPRGLCWTCYYRPGVKELYPSTSKYARRGDGLANRGKKPEHPTDTAPGSAERIAVFAARIARGENLFHPRDARIDDAPAVVLTPLRCAIQTRTPRVSDHDGLWGNFGNTFEAGSGGGSVGSGFEPKWRI